MKLRILATLLLASLVTGLVAVPAAAQTPGLKPAEIDKLSKVLADLRAQPEFPTKRQEKKKQAAEKAWKTELEKLQKAYKDTDILSFTASWQEVFANVAAATKVKNPAGKGRVKTEAVFQKVRGRYMGFEYAVYIPNKYKSTERWPLVIALHTKDSTGEKYLKDVWINKKHIPKDMYEKFIFVAPTIGEKTVPKSKKDKRHQRRIEPFSAWHKAGIALCLVDVLQKYNIDTDRMYLDGAGLGGEAAAWIGIMQSKLFAGMAVRNARPVAQKEFSKPHFLGNLKNQAPLLIVDRKDGAYSGADGEAERKRIDHQVQVDSLPVSFRVLEPLADAKARRLALGNKIHNVDPIHDATKGIAEFFLEQKRNLYPSELSYLTYDNRMFKQTAWYRLDSATADPKDGTIATVKGKLDRESNTATFTTTNVESFRIYLNDLLLDLDKPVKVVVNGKEVLETKVERSLEYMLGFNEQNAIDPTLVMVAELRVNVPSEEAKGEEDGK